MEIKTEGAIYQEVKDMFREHGGIDFNNKVNTKWVRVDDAKRYLESYKNRSTIIHNFLHELEGD